MKAPSGFKSMVQEVMEKHFPEEKEIFDSEADGFIAEAEQTGDIAQVRTDAGHKNIDPALIANLVKLVPVITAALDLLKTYLDKRSEAHPQLNQGELIATFRDRLVGAGMNTTTAQTISTEFTERFLELTK